MPVSCAQARVIGTPSRASARGWRSRKGRRLGALVGSEEWWDLRLQRGEGRASGWESHEQNGRVFEDSKVECSSGTLATERSVEA